MDDLREIRLIGALPDDRLDLFAPSALAENRLR